jgi:fructose transport system substrate-binding protein
VELNLSNPFFGTLEKATEAAATANGWNNSYGLRS